MPVPFLFLMWLWRWRLSDEQKGILAQLARGWTLKAHRDLEGNKLYLLHALTDAERRVEAGDVARLFQHKLLYTNHKFPANTYLLTDRGRGIAEAITGIEITALGSSHPLED